MNHPNLEQLPAETILLRLDLILDVLDYQERALQEEDPTGLKHGYLLAANTVRAFLKG